MHFAGSLSRRRLLRSLSTIALSSPPPEDVLEPPPPQADRANAAASSTKGSMSRDFFTDSFREDGPVGHALTGWVSLIGKRRKRLEVCRAERQPPAAAPTIRAMTYSLVAFDPDTGEHGVAVQSNWFSVGTLVTFGAAGGRSGRHPGEPAPGVRAATGWSWMRAGQSAAEALAELTAADPLEHEAARWR